MKLITSWDDDSLCARAMDEASKEDFLGHLESHLMHGVLSQREMAQQMVNGKTSVEGQVRMETYSDEISVYPLMQFRAWAVFLHYSAGIFVDAPLTLSRNPKVSHPVIKDNVPIDCRKIVGVYVNTSMFGNLSEKQIERAVEMVARVRPLPVYGHGLEVLWAPLRGA
jgi:hypothetical protein